MKVSIIVATPSPLTKSEPLIESLGSALDSPELLEVVIVVNGDSAIASAREHLATHGTAHEKVRVVFEDTESLLAGRHRGFAETSGDIFSLLDDDVTVHPGWFEALLEAFSRPEVVLAGGPSFPIFDGEPPGWLDRLSFSPNGLDTMIPFLSLLNLGDEPIVPVDPNLIWGLNLAIRRQTLIDIGGFHPDTLKRSHQIYQGDGDTGVTRKIAALGLTAGYFPGLAVNHHIPAHRITKDYVIERAFQEGICEEFLRLRNSHRGELPTQKRTSKNPLRTAGRSGRNLAYRLLPDSIAKAHLPTLIGKHRMRGTRFMSNNFKKYTEVRDWATRDTYWDWKHPELPEGYPKT